MNSIFRVLFLEPKPEKVLLYEFKKSLVKFLFYVQDDLENRTLSLEKLKYLEKKQCDMEIQFPVEEV